MQASEGDVDFRRVLKAIYHGRWYVAAFTVLCVVGGAAVAVMAKEVYRTEAVLAPVAAMDSTSVPSSVLRSLGGLASIGGLSLDKGLVDPAVVSIEMLQGRDFLTRTARKHELVVPMLAGTRWNPVTGELALDASIYDTATARWKGKWGVARANAPTDTDIYKGFRARLKVKRDSRSGLVRVSLTAPSPDMAKDWLERTIDDLNSTIRYRDIERLKKNIDVLIQKSQAIEVASVRDALHLVIEEQFRQLSLAESRSDYAFQYVDPPYRPDTLWWPRRALLVGTASILGLLVGVGASLARFYSARQDVCER